MPEQNTDHFDLVVVGSGSGNTIVDDRFRDWKVALVEKSPTFGGTCLNVGCIPTKMFVRAADAARTPHDAARLGVTFAEPTVDWPAIRDRVFGRIDPIATAGAHYRDSAENLTLLRAPARFVGERTLRVGGRTITADRIVLAVGSRPRALDVPGADDVTVHTSDTIMRLPALPRRMVIIGGGFVAVELAHVFDALGVEIVLVQRSDRLLTQHDPDVSRRFTDLFAERMTVRLGQVVTALRRGENDVIEVETRDGEGVTYSYDADVVLEATGRVSNADTLDVAATGLTLDPANRLVVDARQQTAVEGIWALGDCANAHQLKHVANYEARIVQHNLLHPDDPIERDQRPVPAAVFSDPQIASVGLTEAAAREAGLDVTVATQEYASVAYGWALEDTTSFVKLVAERGSGRILGASILGPDAANLVQPLVQAMTFGLDAATMARGQYWIHPALTEVIENALLSLDL